MSSVPKHESGPAFDLMGLSVADGWVITQRLPRAGEPGAEDQTGGHFSVGYVATKGKRRAFVKAIDVHGVLTDRSTGESLMVRLKRMTDRHAFESAILDACKKAKLDRIVEIIASGELEVPNAQIPILVPFIMFEMADGDVRKAIATSAKVDAAWKFKVLHDVAVGIQQLHRNDIAHQDLKPSNVLLFLDNDLAKIGDLGRSSRRGANAEHDGYDVPGAVGYAPPEQIFGIRAERWEDRREGCDVYHLGSLAVFLFTGVVLSVHFAEALPPEMRPYLWGGRAGTDYESALPLLKKALTEFVLDVRPQFPVWAADELSLIIIATCDPDYRIRGDAAARRRVGNNVGIEVFVSRFDRMAKAAAVKRN